MMIDQKIDILRRYKAQEDLVKEKRKRNAINNRMNHISNNKINMSSRSIEQSGVHPSTYDSRKAVGVNINKVPPLSGIAANVFVDPSYVTVNTESQRKKKKGVFGERPMSSQSNNSKYTAKMTAAYTQFSAGGVTNKSMNTNAEADEIAQKIMNDKDFRLVEFLKYDSGLGREQNIEMGNASSLAA